MKMDTESGARYIEMEKFRITIEETVSKDFDIYADTAEEAMEVAKSKYDSGEFVLDPGNLMSKQMILTSSENDVTDWIEF